MRDYRKLFCDYYNVKIPTDWDVHHIDYDHNNNDPSNLVALPKKLHRRLHRTHNEFVHWCTNRDMNIIKIHDGFCGCTLAAQQSLLDYLTAVEDCTKYMNFRNGKVHSFIEGIDDD